jgi:hypothetical protein
MTFLCMAIAMLLNGIRDGLESFELDSICVFQASRLDDTLFFSFFLFHRLIQ